MDSVNDDAKGVGYRRIEVLTGPGRRRKWSDDDKARIVAETTQPGAVVTEVARRWQVSPQQVFDWRRQARKALEAARSEEHTSELQSRQYLVCRLLLEKKKKKSKRNILCN